MVDQQFFGGTSANESVSKGIVYILSNPAMEGYIKIGMTGGDSPQDVLKRMQNLDTTGVPRAFECEYAAVVDSYTAVEKALHVAFGDRRVRNNREFFENLDPQRPKAVLKLLEIRDVTPGTNDELDVGATEAPEREKPLKRSRFKFSMVGISVGEQLAWADDSSILCQVVEDDRVSYHGQIYSLSALAKKLKGIDRPLQGPMYFMYDEETLTERRRRLEDEDEDS